MNRSRAGVPQQNSIRNSAADDDEPIVLACPACGSPRTRIIAVDVIARLVTLKCQDCGVTSPGVRY
jgi:transcription elongation factor Elf1